MKSHTTFLVAASALAALLLTPVPATADDGGAGVLTRVHLLVGFPSAAEGDSPGVLVAPGTVIPLEGGNPRPDAGAEASQGAAEAFFSLAESLQRTVRLESVDARYRLVRPFALNEPTSLPSPSSSSPIGLSATLLGFSGDLASYRVQFTEGEEVLADTRVAVKRGGRTVVGGLDGEAAPYIFLVLEPLSDGESQEVSWLAEDFTPPRALSRPQPTYTPEAKANKTQGVVILQAIIGEDGQVQDINVLKGLEDGLTEAAADAVGRWLFEPALDAAGEPVAVYYNLTINFQLQK